MSSASSLFSPWGTSLFFQLVLLPLREGRNFSFSLSLERVRRLFLRKNPGASFFYDRPGIFSIF